MVSNKVKQLLDCRGISRYRFWKDTGIAQRTAYDLYNNPEQYLGRDVMNAVCQIYGVQPGDLLEWVEDD